MIVIAVTVENAMMTRPNGTITPNVMARSPVWMRTTAAGVMLSTVT